MKTIFAILAFSFTLSLTNAQTVKEVNVPTAVKDAFTKQHPNTKAEKWEQEDGNYEVEFHIDKTENSIVYSPAGALIQLETEIAVSELPKAITDYISTNMSGKKVKEASKIITPEGTISYEAEIDGVDYLFNSNGSLIKKEEEKDKDND